MSDKLKGNVKVGQKVRCVTSAGIYQKGQVIEVTTSNVDFFDTFVGVYFEIV